MNIIDYDQVYGIETVKMWRKSKEEALGFEDIHKEASYLNFLNEYLLPNYRVRLAIDEKKNCVLGFIVYNDEEINQMYIANNAQGHGIGKKLLNEAKENAKGQLWLYTFQKNIEAVGFYKSQGFIIKKAGNDNEEGEDDWLMAWSPNTVYDVNKE